MYKYLFEFQNGSTVLVEAANKMKATETVASTYLKLFETENFRVVRVGVELDSKGKLKEFD
ncbi:hypothetical protein [Robertmurraya siralis]|uniref:hypothetical protein n=1 Tax=Robertmurraya siralis TaxID=77777 RepID=UPI0010F961D0|nr:hypothetical protein [Robertmurraya siralis]